MANASQKIIVALDDLNLEQALQVVEQTKDYAETFKVGLALFTMIGPAGVRRIKDLGVEIFLDLKLHDIPMQVEKAVENALLMQPKFLTVHALGGEKMLKDCALIVRNSPTKLLAVTVLTSTDEDQWRKLGFSEAIEPSVARLIDLSVKSGIQGVVSSPREAAAIKARYGNDAFVVCPGVRPKNASLDDQSRVLSPFEAIKNGADALVVGRPITKAKNMREAAQLINEEVQWAITDLTKNPPAINQAL